MSPALLLSFHREYVRPIFLREWRPDAWILLIDTTFMGVGTRKGSRFLMTDPIAGWRKVLCGRS